MSRRLPVSFLLTASLLLPAAAPPLTAEPNHERAVWNYDGGLQIGTEGSIPAGPCFGISGRVTAEHYFDNLKRVDSDVGTFFHRGSEIVTEYPETLHLGFLMSDFPCDAQLWPSRPRLYLTQTLVSTLRLSFYWKRGLVMRPVSGVVPKHFEKHPLMPYAVNLASTLPQRFEWVFEFDIPSAGVPVTDSLVMVLLTADGRIAARAAARM